MEEKNSALYSIIAHGFGNAFHIILFSVIRKEKKKEISNFKDKKGNSKYKEKRKYYQKKREFIFLIYNYYEKLYLII